jgi:hypothetical protein
MRDALILMGFLLVVILWDRSNSIPGNRTSPRISDSGASEESEPDSVEQHFKVETVKGNPGLAKPFVVLGPDANSSHQIWILSETATTPEERAATAYAAGLALKSTGAVKGEFSVLLGLHNDLIGIIPRSDFSLRLYSARASYCTRTFVGGKWKEVPQWDVNAASPSQTLETLATLQAIYAAAKTKNLQTTEDFEQFMAASQGVTNEEAKKLVWAAFNVGTPGKRFEFP